MLIGIDGNEANVERKVGIGQYASELIRHLNIDSFDNPSRDYTVYLKEDPGYFLPNASANWRYRLLRPGKLWTQWRLPLDLYLKFPRPEVFFSLSHYAPRFSPVPTVVSVMDVSYLYFPRYFRSTDLYQLKEWTRYSVRKARAVITISQSAKDDIIKAYKIPRERVYIVYPGIKNITDLKPRVYPMNELRNKYGISTRYILFVGTLQPRKNIEKLIEAFSLIGNNNKDLKNRDEDLQLVIVGKKGWLYEPILAAPEKFGIKDKVKFLDFVPDEDLPLLYSHARCYVLPSLYEGFGLPVLEAMKYDCPVIASNISSLPEAGGDAALYIDPKDASDIAKKINMLVEDESLRKKMIEKGKIQIKKFSWEKAARETLQILENVAAGK